MLVIKINCSVTLVLVLLFKCSLRQEEYACQWALDIFSNANRLIKTAILVAVSTCFICIHSAIFKIGMIHYCFATEYLSFEDMRLNQGKTWDVDWSARHAGAIFRTLIILTSGANITNFMPSVIFASTISILIFEIAEVVSSRPNNWDYGFVTLLALLILAYRVNILDKGLVPVKSKRFEIRYFGLNRKSELLSRSKNNADKASGEY